MQNTNWSLIPDLDNEFSDSRRKTVLKKCFDRVSQNLAMESIFVRSRDTGRAQVSNAIPTYSLKLLFNSVIIRLVKWLKLETNPICEAGKL